jgi:hypothetical protein
MFGYLNFKVPTYFAFIIIIVLAAFCIFTVRVYYNVVVGEINKASAVLELNQ